MVKAVLIKECCRCRSVLGSLRRGADLSLFYVRKLVGARAAIDRRENDSINHRPVVAVDLVVLETHVRRLPGRCDCPERRGRITWGPRRGQYMGDGHTLVAEGVFDALEIPRAIAGVLLEVPGRPIRKVDLSRVHQIAKTQAGSVEGVRRATVRDRLDPGGGAPCVRSPWAFKAMIPAVRSLVDILVVRHRGVVVWDEAPHAEQPSRSGVGTCGRLRPYAVLPIAEIPDLAVVAERQTVREIPIQGVGRSDGQLDN